MRSNKIKTIKIEEELIHKEIMLKLLMMALKILLIFRIRMKIQIIDSLHRIECTETAELPGARDREITIMID